MKTTKLEWDSDFFNLSISKIEMNLNDSLETLSTELSRSTDIDLYYIFTSNDYEDIELANLTKVDEKIVFGADICQLPIVECHSIVEYDKNVCRIKDLYNLAYESGKYSRFLLDHNFKEEQFKTLYRTWIDKSVSGEMADVIFCYQDSRELLGMLTLKVDDQVAEIGLVGVSAKLQGKGIGKQLMSKVRKYAEIKNIKQIIVPTQSHNPIACNYYMKCGFVEQSRTKIYHYWK